PLEGEPGVKETLIPVKWLFERLAACPARQKALILDVCRRNPERSPERPLGGAEEPKEKLDGAMWAKLDEQLQQPPENVQVWVSCVADQYSYELDDSLNHGGLFLEYLGLELKSAATQTQSPEDAFLLERLVAGVNQRLTDALAI